MAVPGESDHLLLIVTGTCLQAENIDRPLAYQLRTQIFTKLKKFGVMLNTRTWPVVCSDIHYMNNEALQMRPTVSIGGTSVNALSVYYRDKLTVAEERKGSFCILLDPEFTDLRVCLLAENDRHTPIVIKLFCQKYLDAYLRAVVTQVEPQDE